MDKTPPPGEGPEATAQAKLHSSIPSPVQGRTGTALAPLLRQVVADLKGLGGMVHLRESGPGRRLRLVESSGLSQDLARSFQEIHWHEDLPTARALREEGAVWLPLSPEELSHPLPFPAGMVAVPLHSSEGLGGVLSVVTAGPDPPSAVQRGYLEAVARWLLGALGHTPAAAHDTTRTRSDENTATGYALQHALDEVPVGAWDWNIHTGDVVWDDAMTRVLGIGPDDFDGRIETWRAMIHPEDLPAVLTHAEQSQRKNAEYSVKHRVRRRDGSVGWVEVRGRTLLGEDGEPAHMVGRLWAITQTRAVMESAGRALRHMSDGFLAVDTEWRILYLNLQAEQLLGASRELVGRTLWEVPTIRVPGLESRCRRAVVDRTPTGLDRQLPADGRWYHLRLIPVPDGLTVYLTDITERRQLEAERAAVERAAAERSARIGELTAALAEALTAEDVVAAAAERVLPLFGATGLIVQAREGDRLQAVGAVGYPQPFMDRFAEGPLPLGTPADHTVPDGTPRFIASPEEMEAEYPALRTLVALSGKRAWAFLPLMVSGRQVGGCVVSFDRTRRLTGEERTLLIALSGLVAQALERARQYDAEHGRAQALQRGLLPRALPCLPAVTTAARYLPASEGMLGGDWYDVIPLSAERVALVIGDVMGHGLPEAATMGRLRTAVHTLAGLELPPDELFSHLNDLVSDLGDDFYATCLYALYDPATGVCTFVGAGHPPPAVIHPDGTVRFPGLAANPPLGSATPPFDTTDVELPEGSLLVLYTDGFVESARRDIDTGIAQLATALTTGLDGMARHGTAGDCSDSARDTEARTLDRLGDTLVSTLLPAPERTHDDAALLLARTHTLTARNVVSWTLSDDPVAAGQARDHIRRQLDQWQLDELVMTTELIASELVGNVVRHAKGPVRLRLLRGRTLICEVSDGSLTTPRIRRARETDEGGRGLQLVAALSQRWGTRYTTDGKCIWTEQALPGTPR
ncbi:SpoIIE family protein phosphatase [Wenjunlia tyrosinilytica]|uniref:SpoIIE family protein phosphatase n=1 Tax=Wenjunlia tyrosinilytica TaxID=1544741 RepID=UPI001E40626E|nr:SpoIIE family protein phosphatase [Wenjunlia tyrosinilytica]